MKSIYNIFIVFLFVLALASCRSLPKEKFSQFSIDASYEVVDGGLELKVNNVLHCPIRINGDSEDQHLDSLFNRVNPMTVPARKDTIFRFDLGNDAEPKVRFSINLGDPQKEVKHKPILYPFPKGKTYNVVQGNNSKPTHNTNYSRYAVDFGLNINDTICSATDGYVVGVIKDYKYGGSGSKWRPYSNFITIYDAQAGVLLQYVHLVHQGSFVQVGDHVKAGQAIGLSGMTGQTNIEHLHFNYLVASESGDGVKSHPFEFIDGRKSTALKRGEKLTRN